MMRTFVAATLAASLAGCTASGQKVTTTEIHNRQRVDVDVQVHRVKAARAPTVILLHGCGGPVYPHFQAWIDALNAWGYNAVVLDSLRARRVSQVCDHPSTVVSKEQRSVDAYDAASWVMRQEWATDKVALIGFSHGAAAVLYAVASKDVERNFGKQVISAAVAYYPDCENRFNWDRPVIPVQFHTAGNDSWNPEGPCASLARNWNVLDQYFRYENATHGFDLVGFNRQSIPDNSGRRHWLIYDAAATDLSRQRTKAFLDMHLR